MADDADGASTRHRTASRGAVTAVFRRFQVKHPDMITRLSVLSSAMLLTGCGYAQRELPSCWVNKSFGDGERVAGRITLLIADQADSLMDGPMIMVSPLTCENGSFIVIDPPAELTKLRKPQSSDRPVFGSVYEADVSGTVRLLRWQTHAGPGSPYTLKLSSVRRLNAIREPRWWKP
jgi:hypothetical protein